MQCREACGACCIAPSIDHAYFGMPDGKAAGERCVHLDDDMLCGLFGDSRRPHYCATFMAEPSVCGTSREQALLLLTQLEVFTLPSVYAPGAKA